MVQLTGIRAVIFDLDDTLCPERSFAFSGFSAVGRWLSQRMACPFDPAERMKALFETEHRPRVFDQLLAELGCSTPEQMVSAMIECYRSHVPQIELPVDADRALSRWSKDFFLGLISDGPWQMQERKVQALGLQDRLDLVVLTDRWGRQYWKPHPRAFEVMEERSGHKGRACLYVADNPAKDFVAPNALGWRTVRVRRPGCVYGGISPASGGSPQFEVQSLDEVDLGL